MNTPEPITPDSEPQATEKSPVRFILPLLGVIAIVAGIGYFASKTVVSKEFVQAQLDGWIEAREAQAKTEGFYLDISYDDLTFEAGIVNQRATLSNARVHVAMFEGPLQATASAEQSLMLRTDMLEIEPTSVDLSAFRLRFTAPLALRYADDTFDAVTISSEEPLVFDAKQEETKHGAELVVNHGFVDSLQLMLQDGADAATQKVSVIVGDGATLATRIVMDQPRFGRTQLSLDDVVINSDEEMLLSIDDASADWKKYPNDAGEEASVSRVELDDVSGPLLGTLNEIDLRWDIATTSKLASDAASSGMMAMQEAQVDIRTLELDAQGASFKAKGAFEAKEGDLLPVGAAQIDIVNLRKLREFLAANGVLTADDEVLMDKLLTAMTGQGINAEGDITIAVKRDRDGPFTLGNIQFEEALSIVLGHNFEQAKQEALEPEAENDEASEATKE